jgi:hypothetical protein
MLTDTQCRTAKPKDKPYKLSDGKGLGWQAGIANPKGDKPKGMHWRTFERLKAEHDAFANASWAGMAERLGLMNRRIVGLGIEPLDELSH